MSQTNLYSVTVPPMVKALKQLSGLIDKGMAHADTKANPYHPAVEYERALLDDKLIFDQFSLMRQVQIVTDNAKGAVHRLTGIEVPKFEDTMQNATELKERIAKTIAILEGITPEMMADAETKRVMLPYYPEKYLTGFEYATQYLIPNFYFHLTTAFSVLRKNGIDVGKSDYIGDLPLKDL